MPSLLMRQCVWKCRWGKILIKGIIVVSAKVCNHADFLAVCFDDISHRVCRVMGNGYRVHLNSVGLKTCEMEAVLVTHEHIDHIAGSFQ